MMSLNIRIPDNVGARLVSLAEKTGRTKSYYVRAAIEEKLQDLEDYFLALESLEKIESGKSKIWSHKDIETGRDLED